MDHLLVMKFGGTSVGSAERIEGAADLIAADARVRPTVAVVSAMSKVTDLLLDTLQKAENGDEAGLEANLLALRGKHLEACHKLLPAEAQSFVTQRIEELISGFERIARGMLLLGERPLRSVDQAIATGERLSALLVSAVLESRGIAAEAVDAAEAIVTDDDFGCASPLMEETREKARGRLLPALKAGRIPIVTGFNGATRDGRPTTLGRGGSDFSGAILAAALDAEEVWIWTDVDGILSADPRVVADARVLPEVTYNEAAELAYNGAKVLHPRTLIPLAERQIPVWIKNSFSPEKPGTRIGPAIGDVRGAHAITSLGKVALISIEAVRPEADHSTSTASSPIEIACPASY
jgi:aspartate kinase